MNFLQPVLLLDQPLLATRYRLKCVRTSYRFEVCEQAQPLLVWDGGWRSIGINGQLALNIFTLRPGEEAFEWN